MQLNLLRMIETDPSLIRAGKLEPKHRSLVLGGMLLISMEMETVVSRDTLEVMEVALHINSTITSILSTTT